MTPIGWMLFGAVVGIVLDGLVVDHLLPWLLRRRTNR